MVKCLINQLRVRLVFTLNAVVMAVDKEFNLLSNLVVISIQLKCLLRDHQDSVTLEMESDLIL